MALPLPQGKLFHIEHRLLSTDYEMPSYEAAFEHYELGYLIKGDRTIITPVMIYTTHAGDVSAMAPYVYHRTVPASDEVYESILVKFSPLYVKALTDSFGEQLLEDIFSHTVNRFDENIHAKIRGMFYDMLKEYKEAGRYSDFKIQCILSQLLLTMDESRLSDESESVKRTALTPPIIEAIYYMEKNYAKQICVEEAAEAANYSTAYFSRLFHEQTGKSYIAYLTGIRIKNAQNLLLNTDRTITEIALDTGYQYPGNFTAAFRKSTGMSPQQYRKRSKNKRD